MRDARINDAIARALSRTRLEKYLTASGSDLDLAIGLYERNTRLAEAFYTPLQALEVCLRNRLNDRLTERYGENWMQSESVTLNSWAVQAVKDAVADLGRTKTNPTPGAVVAELHFGFWLSLLGPGYDATLWRETCYRAFQANGRFLARKRVHGRLNALRRFRNRVAHHEPIFHSDIEQTHEEILETIDWMCGLTSTWARHHSRLPQVFAAP